VDLSREELAAWRRVGSRRGEATALRHVAVSIQHLGGAEEATRLCHDALAIWTDLDDPAAVAHVQLTLGDLARDGGDPAEAVRRYDAALVDFQAIGDRRCTASTYKNLGAIATRRGDHGRAATWLQQALLLRDELGDEAGLAEVLEALAGLAVTDERDEHAATLLGAAAAVRERTGSVAAPADAALAAEVLDAVRRRVGADHVTAAGRRGAGLSVVDVVAYALDG
jgi:tetratricopeptide (TPR) repeat protein